MKLFDLGRIANTGTFDDWVCDNPQLAQHVARCVRRHVTGDFGDMPDEDKAVNRQAIADGGRVHSAYPCDPAVTGGRKFWIITEADRSVTTLLFPEDY